MQYQNCHIHNPLKHTSMNSKSVHLDTQCALKGTKAARCYHDRLQLLSCRNTFIVFEAFDLGSKRDRFARASSRRATFTANALGFLCFLRTNRPHPCGPRLMLIDTMLLFESFQLGLTFFEVSFRLDHLFLLMI
jgi:hypothetical protein